MSKRYRLDVAQPIPIPMSPFEFHVSLAREIQDRNRCDPHQIDKR